MIDFIFSDPSESTSVVIFRTDLIGSGENFTVHTIKGLEDVKSWQTKKALLLGFKQLPHSKSEFMAFALAHGLNLVMQDSNGEHQVELIDYDSDGDTHSW